MTRRTFLALAPGSFLARGRAVSTPVVVPVRVIVDGKVNWRPQSLRRFWYGIWPEAVRDFASSGIILAAAAGTGDVGRPPGREPVVSGLDPFSLNLVVTNRIPMEWDSGRGICGVTLRYRGYHLCMIALSRAHGNQIPYVSTNTCVHEMLHAFLHDIFESRPGTVSGQYREFRVDACATRLWLLGGASGIRESARKYVSRLRAEAVPRT
jgi:hypothetical protein